MFKRAMRNTSVNVKLVSDKDKENTTTEQDMADAWANVEIAAAYAEIAKDVITHAAFTIGGVFAACKIIERICK